MCSNVPLKGLGFTKCPEQEPNLTLLMREFIEARIKEHPDWFEISLDEYGFTVVRQIYFPPFNAQ